MGATWCLLSATSTRLKFLSCTGGTIKSFALRWSRNLDLYVYPCFRRTQGSTLLESSYGVYCTHPHANWANTLHKTMDIIAIIYIITRKDVTCCIWDDNSCSVQKTKHLHIIMPPEGSFHKTRTQKHHAWIGLVKGTNIRMQDWFSRLECCTLSLLCTIFL